MSKKIIHFFLFYKWGTFTNYICRISIKKNSRVSTQVSNDQAWKKDIINLTFLFYSFSDLLKIYFYSLLLDTALYPVHWCQSDLNVLIEQRDRIIRTSQNLAKITSSYLRWKLIMTGHLPLHFGRIISHNEAHSPLLYSVGHCHKLVSVHADQGKPVDFLGQELLKLGLSSYTSCEFQIFYLTCNFERSFWVGFSN